MSQVRIGSVLNRVWFGSGSSYPFSVHLGSGHYGSGLNWVGSFQVMLQFGFCLVLDRFTSGLQVQINLLHFGCRFEYESELFGLGFGSWVSFVRSKYDLLDI